MENKLSLNQLVDVCDEDLSRVKMRPRFFRFFIYMLVIIIGLSIGINTLLPVNCSDAGIIDLFIGGVEPPFKKNIKIDKKGMVINDKFTIKKKCYYVSELRFIHKQRKFDEYKELFISKSFNFKYLMKISKRNENKYSVVYISKNYINNDDHLMGKGLGKSIYSTDFILDGFELDEGEYTVNLQLLNDNGTAENIDILFVITVRPKATC